MLRGIAKDPIPLIGPYHDALPAEAPHTLVLTRLMARRLIKPIGSGEESCIAVTSRGLFELRKHNPRHGT